MCSISPRFSSLLHQVEMVYPQIVDKIYQVYPRNLTYLKGALRNFDPISPSDGIEIVKNKIEETAKKLPKLRKEIHEQTEEINKVSKELDETFWHVVFLYFGEEKEISQKAKNIYEKMVNAPHVDLVKRLSMCKEHLQELRIFVFQVEIAYEMIEKVYGPLPNNFEELQRWQIRIDSIRSKNSHMLPKTLLLVLDKCQTIIKNKMHNPCNKPYEPSKETKIPSLEHVEEIRYSVQKEIVLAAKKKVSTAGLLLSNRTWSCPKKLEKKPPKPHKILASPERTPRAPVKKPHILTIFLPYAVPRKKSLPVSPN